MHYLTLALSGSLLLVTACIGSAASATNVMEEVVVTATKTEKSYRSTPYSVSVLNQQALALQPRGQLADLLRDVPGLQLTDSGQAGQKRLRIRGEEARRMALLINGQEFLDHREVGVPLLVNPYAIERIEVIKGPASVLYGPRAMGGVVNVITRGAPQGPLEGNIGITSDGSTRGTDRFASLGGRAGGLSASLSAMDSDHGLRKTPEGKLHNTRYEHKGVMANLGYQQGAHTARLSVDDFNASSEVYVEPEVRFTPPFTDFAIDIPRRDRRSVSLGYTWQNGADEGLSKLEVSAYRQVSDREFNTFPTLQLGPISRATEIYTNSQLVSLGTNVQAIFNLGDSLEWVAGYQFVSDEVDQDRVREETNNLIASPTELNHDQAELDTHALYLQQDWQVSPSLALLLGARHYRIQGEHTTRSRQAGPADFSDQKTIGSAALVYDWLENTTLRANLSQGYIYPSLMNLAVGAYAGSRYINADPNLTPETSLSRELGIRHRGIDYTAEATVYYTTADNYIDHVFCSALDPCLTSRDKIYRNVGEVQTVGLELTGTWSVAGWQMVGNLNWQHREERTEGFRTSNTGWPKVSANLTMHHALNLPTAPHLSLALNGAVSVVEESLSSSGRPQREEHAGFVTTDLGLNWQFEALQLIASVDNVLDQKYQPATQNLLAPGRHLKLRLNYRFNK